MATSDDANLGRLAKRWLEKATGSLFGDPMQNSRRAQEEAAARRDLKREAAERTERQVLKAALPASWNERIEAARPENRAARAAEAHRTELLAGEQAHVEIRLSGDVAGAIDGTVALDVQWQQPWKVWRLCLEAADPVPIGSTDFRRLVVTVPVEAVDDDCDLASWTLANEGRFDPLDFELQLGDTIEPQQWAADFGSAPVRIVGDSVVAALPTQDPGGRRVQLEATIECSAGTFGPGSALYGSD